MISVMPSKKSTASCISYVFKLKGTLPLLMNKIPSSMGATIAEGIKQEKEDPIVRERRTWREKLYTDDKGQVCVPYYNVWRSFVMGARNWGEKVKGNKTYASVFETSTIPNGVYMYLGLHKDDERIIEYGSTVNGNPSSPSGKSSKVWRIRPMISEWEGEFNLIVTDARLTPDVLYNVVSFAGNTAGIGDWRQRFGKYELVDILRDE